MLPALFLSYGVSTLTMSDAVTRDVLVRPGDCLSSPAAIIVVSAQWDTPLPTVTGAARNEAIHDSGLPPLLQSLDYPAPGSPALAERVTDLLAAQGLDGRVDDTRGLDHGARVPLMLMYPAHDIPVIQLSLQSRLGPGHHFQLGKAMAPLRRENILILGCGSLTPRSSDVAAESAWAGEFARWIDDALTGASTGARVCDLMSYRRRAPHAQSAHPSEEQLLPLFVALGAGCNPDDTSCEGARPSAVRLHAGTACAAARLYAYAFS